MSKSQFLLSVAGGSWVTGHSETTICNSGTSFRQLTDCTNRARPLLASAAEQGALRCAPYLFMQVRPHHSLSAGAYLR
jgi:hypothetical protein